ncbi:hypothetical protein GCM10009562_14990 [Nocardioides aquaticus]
MSAYPETTHWIVPGEVSSPACIEGIATFTIETSSSDMNPTTSETARMRQRRGSGAATSLTGTLWGTGLPPKGRVARVPDATCWPA